MDSSLIKTFSDFGIAGILGYAVYFLLQYLKSKDDIIGKLIAVNQEQNKAIAETNNYLKELSERQKKMAEYADIGAWWSMQHQPNSEICTACPDFKNCPHPRKPLK